MAEEHPLVVYVVDDDAGVRDALVRLVHSAGHDVRSSPTLEDISAIATGRPGCVLFDLSAGSPGTRSAAAHLRERGIELPMIALTGDDGEASDRAARRAGAVMLFRKPVDGRALLDAIQWLAHEGAPKPDKETRR